MKYSIYFVLNSAYIKFGKIFLNSLYDKVDINNIKHIYLSDTGLDEEDKKYVESFYKVKVVDSGVVTNFEGGSWGEDWHKTVASKTIMLRELLKNEDCPIMMVDGDCMFIGDVEDLIDYSYDVQICHRPHVPHCPYLGSFVILQPNEKSMSFLNRWVEIIESTKEFMDGMVKAKESPALSQAVVELEKHISIGNVPYNVVSVTESKDIVDKTKIVHFKGSSLSKNFDELYEKRVISRGFTEMVDKYLKENLNIMFLCSKEYYDRKMSRVRFHSMEAVGELCNVTWWGKGWDGYDNEATVQENINNIENKPDMIVTYKPLEMKDMKGTDIPVCLRYNETYDDEWTIKEINDSGAEFIIFHHENDLVYPMSRYQEHYKTHRPEEVTFVHIPHCAEKTIYKPMKEIEKTYDVLLIGAVGYQSRIGDHYPLRNKMVRLLDYLQPDYNVGMWQRPPGRIDNAYDNESAIQFAKAINNAKICVTDSGLPKSRFGKYIEVPMCGTVLAADIPNQDQEDFKKFLIEIDVEMPGDEILDKLRFYLENDEERDKLIKNGLEWSQNYTQENYAEMFVKEVKIYLESINVYA